MVKQVIIKPLLSRLFLYSTLLNSKRVASDTSIIGFAMSKGRIFTNPNTAKSTVIIDKMIFAIFIQSHSFVKSRFVALLLYENHTIGLRTNPPHFSLSAALFSLSYRRAASRCSSLYGTVRGVVGADRAGRLVKPPEFGPSLLILKRDKRNSQLAFPAGHAIIK